MTTTLAATLVVLALIDSTSFGTLLIPIWLLLAPGRPRVGRVLVFLGTVAGFYLALGIAILGGATLVLERAGDLLEHEAVVRAQLVLGVGLVVWGLWIGRSGTRGSGRLHRWRERMTDADHGGPVPIMGLALTAALLEAATMLPYLGATALISRSGMEPIAQVGVLAAYCLVMLLPALLLLVARVAAAGLVEPVLVRVGSWMESASGETTAWVVGIVGFLLARDAAGRLPEVARLLAAGGGVG